jgi:hypothetical protein
MGVWQVAGPGVDRTHHQHLDVDGRVAQWWQLGLLQLQDILRLAMAGKGECSAAHGRRLQAPQVAPTSSCKGPTPQAAHAQHGQAGPANTWSLRRDLVGLRRAT